MKWIKENWNSGAITLTAVTGWGLAIITTLTGLFVAQVSATNTQLASTRVDVAQLQANYTNIKETTSRIEKKLDEVLENRK